MKVAGVIFDMDGVLIDARDWHFRALNKGLQIFGEEITYEEHLDRFDGLPTKVKLQMLESEGRLPKVAFRFVEAVKQEWTLREAASLCFPSVDHLILLGRLKASGVKLGVATNSIRKTTTTMLTYAGIYDYFDIILTNEDVLMPKPDPEIYNRACSELGLEPFTCLVVEDSSLGEAAAKKAGCMVLKVDGPNEVNLENLTSFITLKENS